MNTTPPSFQPGQVVQLKSGGPRMTVSSVDPNPSPQDPADICCQWFNGEVVQIGYFPAATLVLGKPFPSVPPQQPATGWIHVDLHKPLRDQPVVWCKGDACQTSRLGFGHEQPEGFNFWLPVPKISTDAQPSSLNSLCTSSYCSQNLQFPKHTAADLQMVISTLTGTPISITWLPDPQDPDGIIGWFEVSAPIKP